MPALARVRSTGLIHTLASDNKRELDMYQQRKQHSMSGRCS